MNVPIEPALRKIAQRIVGENKTAIEWAAVESDDMFQEGDYSGGFDAHEGQFCFSYYASNGEIWFQASLAQMTEIAHGGTPELEGLEAN